MLNCGRGSAALMRCPCAVRKDIPVDAAWQTLRYMVFDLPHDSRPLAMRATRIA